MFRFKRRNTIWLAALSVLMALVIISNNISADAQALLLDALVEGYGGGGKAFDWSLVPRGVPLPVVLSGGLHAENVIEGILRVRPWAVDVSSGVEAARGIKDAAAIRRFCDAVREADARLAGAHP